MNVHAAAEERFVCAAISLHISTEVLYSSLSLSLSVCVLILAQVQS
jgi:hypothetical protein